MRASETEFSSEMLIAQSPPKLSTFCMILGNCDKHHKSLLVCGAVIIKTTNCVYTQNYKGYKRTRPKCKGTIQT